MDPLRVEAEEDAVALEMIDHRRHHHPSPYGQHPHHNQPHRYDLLDEEDRTGLDESVSTTRAQRALSPQSDGHAPPRTATSKVGERMNEL